MTKRKPELYYGYGQPVVYAYEEYVVTNVKLDKDGEMVLYDLGRRAPKNSNLTFETLEEDFIHESLMPIATNGLWYRSIPVVFLMIKEFENQPLIALFPTFNDDYTNPFTCQSYIHIGQHGNASTDWLECENGVSRVATFPEYRDLLVELLNYGGGDEADSYWNLEVVKPLKGMAGEDQRLAWEIARRNQMKERDEVARVWSPDFTSKGV